MKTINLTPTWENLWNLCRDGEFPGVYKELLKPCKLADLINETLDKGGKITITRDENGEMIFDDGLEE